MNEHVDRDMRAIEQMIVDVINNATTRCDDAHVTTLRDAFRARNDDMSRAIAFELNTTLIARRVARSESDA
jgi:hypothetical protein